MLAITPDRSFLGTLQLPGQIDFHREKTPQRLFGNYARVATELSAKCKELEGFFKKVIACNMGASALVFMPDIRLTMTRATAELAIRPIAEIQNTMQKSVALAATSLREQFNAVCEALEQQKFLGTLQFFGNGVCRFSFSTATATDAMLRQYIEKGFRVTERERIHFHLYHIHDLVDTQVRRIGDKSVRIPARVQPIIAAIPQWLLPAAYLVTGNEIASEVHEVDRKKEFVRESEWVGEPTYKVDPALVIGCYVFAGWENGEI